MKKTLACSILLISLFLGCKKVDNSSATTPITPVKKYKISGLVQKGPYINGTQIIMYILDDKLAQTGKVFNTQITDNKGSFELNNVELSSKYVQLSANGYYFNEATNAITLSLLQLNALTDVTDASTINVNILTHLEKRRVEYLVKSGKTFIEAKKTAQQEIFAIFGIQIAQSAVSEKLDIATAGDANAILLAISLIVQGDLSVGDVSELLATISSDLEEDGLITNTGAINKLISNSKLLHLDSIRQNLVKRYQELGVTATMPDFEKYINQFLFHVANKPSAVLKEATMILIHSATLNGIVNPNGAETVVSFEYGLSSSYGTTILAKVSTLYGDTAQNVTVDINNLDSLTTYHYRIKAENSKGVSYSPDSSFTTKKNPISLSTGLVAYYPFSGNAEDSSGNGNHGLVNGALLSDDRFGNPSSAFVFNGINNYIDVKFSNSLAIQSSFSSSVWVYTDGAALLSGECSGAIYSMYESNGCGGYILYTESGGPIGAKHFIGGFGKCNLPGEYFSFNSYCSLPISTECPLKLYSLRWHHIGISIDGLLGIGKVYLDGQLISTSSSAAISMLNYAGSNLIIGNIDKNQCRWWGGKIDDLRLYNRALSEAEITYLASH